MVKHHELEYLMLERVQISLLVFSSESSLINPGLLVKSYSSIILMKEH
jgi:hypothetical protein